MNQDQNVKQVIVMRTDLNMRKGKMVAQGAHASIIDLVRKFRAGKTEKDLDASELLWYFGNFRKICVQVDSEEKLEEIHTKAKAAGLRVHLITDAGLTEFGGVPTKTCLAIGPHFDADIDPITKDLKLL